MIDTTAIALGFRFKQKSEKGLTWPVDWSNQAFLTDQLSTPVWARVVLQVMWPLWSQVIDYSTTRILSLSITSCYQWLTGSLIKMFYESFAINHITTPPFNPRSNGLVERFNILKRALKKYDSRKLKEIGIQHFQQVYCITPNPSTVSGMLLVQFKFARKVRSVFEKLLPENERDSNKTDTVKYFNPSDKIFFKFIKRIKNTGKKT